MEDELKHLLQNASFSHVFVQHKTSVTDAIIFGFCFATGVALFISLAWIIADLLN